ncbi:metallophosphoesterase family protein [Luteolibacter marinus]|uniref:metallophosphoesterase family protein n=1 Tax=Luteolibacter marinus TaxID=2776705 RepID=UPI001866C5E5|nr:metallophosphoesterase [Luteolibacter marinus]
MGKIAILSDIHGNLPAFQSVLREVEESGAGSIVFLGDIVGYGASPAECVELVRQHGGSCVMGNHHEEIRAVRRRGCTFRDPDWRANGYLAGLAQAARALDAVQAEWLAERPYVMKIPDAVVAHAILKDPEGFEYIEDDETAVPTLALLRKEKNQVGFFGHTHVADLFPGDHQALEWLAETPVRIPPGVACAVTVGAVGQPRHPTDRRAGWVLWDPEEGVVEFRRTDYDRLQAAHDILDAGLPLESGLRLLTESELAVLLR